MTHTHANLEVSEKAFCEVARKLRAAGYTHAFGQDGMTIDMHGIALVKQEIRVNMKVAGNATDFRRAVQQIKESL
jgi:hypothetical protein